MPSKDSFKKATEEVRHFLNSDTGELSLADVGADGHGTPDRKKGFSFEDIQKIQKALSPNDKWAAFFARHLKEMN